MRGVDSISLFDGVVAGLNETLLDGVVIGWESGLNWVVDGLPLDWGLPLKWRRVVWLGADLSGISVLHVAIEVFFELMERLGVVVGSFPKRLREPPFFGLFLDDLQ